MKNSCCPSRRAVIFDVDGVLVDSYNAHLESWRRFFQEQGLELSHDEFTATFGRTTREILLERHPHAASLDEQTLRDWDVRKEALYREIAAVRFPAMPGAVELIESLHRARVMLAVGSSGPPENVRLCLQHVDRNGYVQVAVTGDDVTRGKPDPQVFQLAAKRLGLEPRCCVVVEDAPVGIQAAKSAGMKTIGMVSTGRTRQELAPADLTVDCLSAITVESIDRLVSGSELPG